MTQFTHIPFFGEYGYVPPVAAVSRVPWKIFAILVVLSAIVVVFFWLGSRDEIKKQQSETAKANDRANLAEQANKPQRLL